VDTLKCPQEQWKTFGRLISIRKNWCDDVPVGRAHFSQAQKWGFAPIDGKLKRENTDKPGNLSG